MSQSSTYSFPPAGKTAIVTGGSSGIGLACARSLAKEGWNVVITGRREAQLQDAADKITQAMESSCTNNRVSFEVGDASQEEDVIRLFDNVVKRHGESSFQDMTTSMRY